MKSTYCVLCTGEEGYLVNLKDSSGHADFVSEVSTAVRLVSTNMGDLYSTGIKKW
jgi:translation elongation factor EF-G